MATMKSSISFTKPNICDEDWVQSMRRSIVEQDDEQIVDIPVSIFTVPKILLATNPESYIPQQVALGPFHHWRPEVFDMQRYKIYSARRAQKYMNVSFEHVVEDLRKNDENRIRASYHKFLDMSGDALVWMMAIDTAFLLEFLQVYYMKEGGRTLKKVTSAMSHLVDVSGKKLSHMAILRDLVMVENQIPLFLIKKMLFQHQDAVENAGDILKSMLKGLYRELTPFKKEEVQADVDIDDCDHLLDFLYHMTVPNSKELHMDAIEIDVEGITEEVSHGEQQQKSSFGKPGDPGRVMKFIWKFVSKSQTRIYMIFTKFLRKPLMLIMKLPWKVLSRLPILKLLKEPIEQILGNLCGEGEKKPEDESSDSKSLLLEKIKIPSVTEMAKAGIFFSPVKGGILDISFDEKTCTLFLPVINLDVNTEVYLRNLVAYEACVSSGPLVVARFTELMNGIIDTEEDAKILRERGIVLNQLKSDKEVADLWNGMSKSVKLTNVPKMDIVIEGVNKRHEKTWKVRTSKFMKTYVFASWKLLTLIAAFFLLLMMLLQSFCSVYSCSNVFHHLSQIPDDSEMGPG